MIELMMKLSRGMPKKDLLKKEAPLVEDLKRVGIVKDDGKILKISSKYRAGTVEVLRRGGGFLGVLGERQKDLAIEPGDLAGAQKGDLVIAQRLLSKRGRPSAKVVYIVQKAFAFLVGYTQQLEGGVVVLNVRDDTPLLLPEETKKEVLALPPLTVVTIEAQTGKLSLILGNLLDPKVDEMISLALYNKKEQFTQEAQMEASGYGTEVDIRLYPDRTDLRALPFCTIDPVSAKDHDDAIYFDAKNHELYVAIADVSEYVTLFGPIDQEAKERGFSIYLPHKSIPMLPRALSENICSLKPGVNRLSFVCKISLDPVTLEPLAEELFEAVIQSRRKYSYDRVDEFLAGRFDDIDEIDREILKDLLPLFDVTQKLRKKRLKKGFEFISQEIKLTIDEDHNLVGTHIETQTPSHELIEECMLLANKAAARLFEFGIFRTHEEPSREKIEELLEDLATIGIFVKQHQAIPELIRAIQEEAQTAGVQKYVDTLLIKTQKQAAYTADNIGHFGLGFEQYTHFTSPIRRYSDLTLHRLLKAILAKDQKKEEYILRNIESLTVKISELEREAAKVEWDFADRKFARWAKANIGGRFKAVVTSTDPSPIAAIEDKIIGPRIFLEETHVTLFEHLLVEITSSNLATTKITAKVVERLNV